MSARDAAQAAVGPAPAPRLEYRLEPVQVPLLLGLQASHRHLNSQGEGHPGSRASALQAMPVPGPSGVCPLVSHHVHTAQAPGSCPLLTTPYPPPRQSLLLTPTGQHSRDGRWVGTAVAAVPGLGDRKQRQPPSGQPQAGREIQPSRTETEGQLTGSSQAASPQASVQPKRGRRARGVGRATRTSSLRHRSAEALRAVSLMAEQLPARSPLTWSQHPSSGTRASPTGRH